jgi:hypothetical protein
LGRLERALELTVRPASPVLRRGEDLQITLAIRNITGRTVTVCLAHGLVVNFWGLDQQYARGAVLGLVDHPFCERQLSLAALQETTWSATVPKISLPVGQARIMASAQIVSLFNCDRYGCDHAWLKAQYEPLIISE